MLHADAYIESFGEGSGQMILNDIECMGNETSLSQCPHNDSGPHSCVHFQNIGVQCLTGMTIPNKYFGLLLSYSNLGPRCSDGDVRLVEGTSPVVGTVQLCHNQDWGTVCANGWDDRDANVVCRQLGYTSISKY